MKKYYFSLALLLLLSLNGFGQAKILDLQTAVRTALLNNLHHVVTDTPTYEKNGWTGDAQLTASMWLYNFGI